MPNSYGWNHLQVLVGPATADPAPGAGTDRLDRSRIIPQTVARRDHATEAGSREISRDRLAAQSHRLAAAAADIRAGIGPRCPEH